MQSIKIIKLRKIKNKKAISPMIAYVLLIGIAIFMSVMVYSWLKTYVPKDALECPETTSLFIKNYTCDSTELNLTLKNNGNFNIAGYFIRVANKSGQELATIDLSQELKSESSGRVVGNSIIFNVIEYGNTLIPNQEATQRFNIAGLNTIYLIELTPIRVQEQDGKIRTASCGSAKIKEEISC